MSFGPSDYNGDDGMVTCPCGAKHGPTYHFTKCGHEGCETLTCSHCAILCGGCGEAIRCEDHAYRTTYRGSLRKAVQVCSGCRNEAEVGGVSELQQGAPVE